MNGAALAILLGLCAAVVPAPAQQAAERELERGLVLARRGEWQQARRAFEAGRVKAPADPRFLVELAGVEFRLQNPQAAKRRLKAALRLDRGHEYANDFAATLYFLDGNTRAALKYWNRIGKPRIGDIRYDPLPRLDPILLDRAFAAAPGTVLRLEQYDTTLERLDLLDVFGDARLELVPRRDGAFDLSLRNVERPGLGGTWAARALGLTKGIPYRTVHLELFNLRGSGLSSVSLVRWDARKRRYYTSVAGPVGDNAARTFRVDFDARSEEWELPSPAGAPDRFHLNLIRAGASLHFAAGAPWRVHTGFVVAGRSFRRLPSQLARETGFAGGQSLGYRFGLQRNLSPPPETRMRLDCRMDFELGRVFRRSAGQFVRIRSELAWNWHPQPRGDDYRISGRLAGGLIRGAAPFDQIYSLGLERDNDLSLRGHPGTTGGRKGAGPLGREFVLLNLEAGRKIFAGGFWSVRLGPFLDTGAIRDPAERFGAPGWLIDCGLQSQIELVKQLTVTLSYGWDLRSARRAFQGTSASSYPAPF